ncbi:Fpg/Nei family DNA glycosylase [soil metagenome]
MPEGDTVFRAGVRLHAALAGQVLTRCDIRVPTYATVDLTGRHVDEVVSRGKHLLIRAEDATIHSHLKMEGRWDVMRTGDRWRRPGWQARIVLETGRMQAVGFSLGVVEVLTRLSEVKAVGHLGPDLLGADWDPASAVLNLARDGSRPIGEALLDQRNLAGIGNVYRSEICFLRGVLPTRPAAETTDLAGMVDLAKRLLEANRHRSTRVTTGSSDGARLWAYGRWQRPCLRCGTSIQRGDDLAGRVVFWCPQCQT